MSDITKRAMAQSLKKFLRKKDLDKITINNITSDCGVNRQTFYYHFKDIYDLLEWIYVNDLVEKVENDTTIFNWQEKFAYVMNYMLENKDFIIGTYNSVSRKILLDFLFKHYNNLFIGLLNSFKESYDVDEKDKKFIANFYKYGFAGIIEGWIVDEMIEDPDIILKKLNLMITGNLEDSLKKMSKNKK